MALFKSQLATSVSGSVGGTTYAHNKSGMYMRARSVPVQPNSAAQVAVRAALTDLVNRWIDTLTPAERNGWNTYAQNVPVTNPLGDSINNSGQNWFIGCNTPRLQAVSKLSSSLARIDTPPSIYNRGDFTTPTYTIDAVSGISLTFTTGDDWVGEDGAAMFIYMGAPQNVGRNFYKGPYRLIAEIAGDSVTPPTSPKAISAATCASLGYAIPSSNRFWIAVAVTRADGRLSSRRIIGPVLST